jgi:hypothetical protein
MISIQKKILNSFEYIILKSQEFINEDLSNHIIFIKSISFNTKISTDIFILHYWLLESLENNDKCECKRALDCIINAQKIDYDVKILSLNDYIFKDKILSWILNNKIDLPESKNIPYIHFPSTEEVVSSKKEISNLFLILKSKTPHFFKHLSKNTRNIFLCKSNTIAATTSQLFFGSMIISCPEDDFEKDNLLEYYFDTVIHEYAHIRLNMILSNDPIILNESNYEFTSPIRSELRPMLGVFHAFYVLGTVLNIGKRIIGDLKKDIIIPLLSERKKEFLSAANTIKESAILTEYGKNIFYNMTKIHNI